MSSAVDSSQAKTYYSINGIRDSKDSWKDGGIEVVDTINSNSDVLESQDAVIREELNRSLSPRHVNMIAIAGVIGTGLFLSTAKSLSAGGPGSLLINYVIMGVVIYLTMLNLGEMSTFMPISGSYCAYARKFVSESYCFALMCNLWYSDAVSVASDLTALQLVLDYWKTNHQHFPYWAAALIFWFVILSLNVAHVRLYGEAEYWLAMLKVVTVFVFFIMAIIANCGHNQQHEYIGFKNWTYKDAPFVHGFKGFVTIFVSSSFSYGGTETITLTGGEAKNPVRNTPKVIKTVFWRILFFYVFTMFFVSMDIPYDYPNLETKSVLTSPFTIIFQMAGSKSAGSFMNAVILTSAISASNHALFGGSRILYNMGLEGFLPFSKFFTRTNRYKVPYVAVITTWAAGGLCFGGSFIGAGKLFTWLQNIVGVSNQISWLSIAIISIRFRKGLEVQGKVHELKFRNWTYPYGPWFCIIFVSLIILVQGWSAFDPWSTSSFFSFYLELLVFPVCWIFWWLIKRDGFRKAKDMDFAVDKYIQSEEEILLNEQLDNLKGVPRIKQIISDYFL